MKRFLIISCIPFIVLFVVAQSSFAEPKRDCEEYCRNNAGCDHCSTLRNCGAGYETIRHFTRGGKNWHACRKNENGKRCDEWCRNNENCKMCSTLIDCGYDYARMEKFEGSGGNWYACRPRASEAGEGSERNREVCEEWCRNNSSCETCSTKRFCGAGYETIKEFKGQGRDWFACRKKLSHQEASERNRAECETWCRNKENCEMCSTLRGCGPGFEALEHFTGYGENWHACEKNKHGRDCDEYCRDDSYCEQCVREGCRNLKIRSFGDVGDWSACSLPRDTIMIQARQECEEWCPTADYCRACSESCGAYPSVRSFGLYAAGATPWAVVYACDTISNNQYSQRAREECERWCNGRTECFGCSQDCRNDRELRRFGTAVHWSACERHEEPSPTPSPAVTGYSSVYIVNCHTERRSVTIYRVDGATGRWEERGVLRSSYDSYGSCTGENMTVQLEDSHSYTIVAYDEGSSSCSPRDPSTPGCQRNIIPSVLGSEGGPILPITIY
jgi:hypothetical protein